MMKYQRFYNWGKYQEFRLVREDLEKKGPEMWRRYLPVLSLFCGEQDG
jgi:hypothetical protein